jgi:hypothetical protein
MCVILLHDCIGDIDITGKKQDWKSHSGLSSMDLSMLHYIELGKMNMNMAYSLRI